ncbi:PREDICTED: protein FAM207A [Nanorana parkeri]|uniref:protein FAM207A n=1 Tax=Nanorana parkeri TaxID=125878 RepID=UPI000854E827|nr:PREDICTED: protein FAM207A [Nanorana parkeri]
MVGKIKRARQKLHNAAVRVSTQEESGPVVPEYKVPSDGEPPKPLAWHKQDGGKDWAFLCSDIFASTKIDPKKLTQKLEVDTQSLASVKKEEKIQLPKKEKAKQRREQWLQKIEALKLAQQAKKAQAKRKATPVVGDMQPLVDALPELSELTTARKPKAPRKQPKESVKKKKPEPTDYRKMRPAQKRKIIEEEVSRVQELIRDPSYKANPLLAVSEHLLKRMKAEQGILPNL